MKGAKVFRHFIKPILLVLICLLLLAGSLSVPVLALKNKSVWRDYGLRGICLADGKEAVAYLYATEEERELYREATEVWVRDAENYEESARANGALLEIGREPVTEEELFKRFGDNPELKKIIPRGTFYEIQISFDPAELDRGPEEENRPTDQPPLSWVVDGDRKYAPCRVYCKGKSVGNLYDHVWGSYAKPDGHIASE